MTEYIKLHVMVDSHLSGISPTLVFYLNSVMYVGTCYSFSLSGPGWDQSLQGWVVNSDAGVYEVCWHFIFIFINVEDDAPFLVPAQKVW